VQGSKVAGSVKKYEVEHFFSEHACNRSIVPPAHFTLCPSPPE